MRRIIVILSILSLGVLGTLQTSLSAHETNPQVKGTITEVSKHRIEVRTTDGRLVTAHLDAHTRVVGEHGTTSASHLKPGRHVVLRLNGHGEHAMVTEVHLAGAPHHHHASTTRS